MKKCIAAWGAARRGFLPFRGAFAAVILAAPLSGCFEIISAAIEVRTPPAEIALAAPAVARGPCPSQDFAVFLDAFGEDLQVQKGYTHIPLVYGQLNAGLLGTPKSDRAFATRNINSFEGIPVFDSKDGGRILRSKAKRKERGLKLTVEPAGDDNKNTKIATVALPGTKFRLEFHFVNTEECWELVRIDDRST
jgi:hypothetical protein